MKLFADKMMSTRPQGDVEQWALAQLKMPAVNHVPAEGPVALCDRFVFDDATLKALAGSTFDFGDQISGHVTPTPAACAWVDVTARYGWLISGQSAYAIFDFDRWGVRHAATVDLAANSDDDVLIRLSDFVVQMFGGDDPVETHLRNCVGRSAGLIHRLLFALASPRAATSRRVLPGAGLDRGQKAFALRRAQRRLPVFSYNKVDLIRPQTALYRGEMRTAESLAGMRLHQVIGHWRLIDGVIGPYWIWIEGHQRGDADLGTIVKERQVHLDLGGMRRGFCMPTHIGRRGERVEAVR